MPTKIKISYKIGAILVLFVVAVVLSGIGLWSEFNGIRDRYADQAFFNQMLAKLQQLPVESELSSDHTAIRQRLIEEMSALLKSDRHGDDRIAQDWQAYVQLQDREAVERAIQHKNLQSLQSVLRSAIDENHQQQALIEQQLSETDRLNSSIGDMNPSQARLFTIENQSDVLAIVDQHKMELLQVGIAQLHGQQSDQLSVLFHRLLSEKSELDELNSERDQLLKSIDNQARALFQWQQQIDAELVRQQMDAQQQRQIELRLTRTEWVDELMRLTLQAQRGEKDYFLSGAERHAAALLGRLDLIIKRIESNALRQLNAGFATVADAAADYKKVFQHWVEGAEKATSAQVDQAGRRLYATLKRLSYDIHDEKALNQIASRARLEERAALLKRIDWYRAKLAVIRQAVERFLSARSALHRTELLASLDDLKDAYQTEQAFALPIKPMRELESFLQSYPALLDSLDITRQSYEQSADQLANLVVQIKQLKQQKDRAQQQDGYQKRQALFDRLNDLAVQNGILVRLENQFDGSTLKTFFKVQEGAFNPQLLESLQRYQKQDEALALLKLDINDRQQRLIAGVQERLSETERNVASGLHWKDAFWFVFGLVLMAVTLFLLVVPFVRGLTKRVNAAIDYVDALSRGANTGTLDVVCKDELGDLGRSLMELGDRLWPQVVSFQTQSKQFVKELTVNRAHLEDLLRQVEQWRPELARGSNQLAGVTTIAQRFAEQSNSGRDVAQMANRAHDTGRGALQRVEVGLELIADRVDQLAEIAFKANVLALNSAVEAAKAGVGGKGFSVIATEMRQFADNSRKLVRDLNKAVEKGQHELTMAEDLMETTRERLEQGSGHIQTMADTADKQVKSINEVTHRLSQVDKSGSDHVKRLKSLLSRFATLSEQAVNLQKTLSILKANHSATDEHSLMALESDDENFTITHSLS